MSLSSMMMSPRFNPMRNSMRRSAGTSALRSAIPRWISTAQRVDDAGELDEDAVASELDDAPAVLLDLGIDQLAAVPLQRGERAFLVDPHQARVTRGIPGQDRGQA